MVHLTIFHGFSKFRQLKHVFLLVLCLSVYSLQAQGTSDAEVSSGDIYTIGDVQAGGYEHIYFPRPNFIIKKGGIVNYKRLVGKEVEVVSVTYKENQPIVTLKRLDGHRFFGSHRYVKANFSKALDRGELQSP